MNNEDNPFMTLAENIKNMGSNKQQLFYIGKVISIAPLVVDIGELQLDREDLLINKDLLKGIKRKVKINATTVTGNVVTEHSGTLKTFDMQDGYIENLEDIFKINDKVVLITNDQQLFVILCIVG